ESVCRRLAGAFATPSEFANTIGELESQGCCNPGLELANACSVLDEGHVRARTARGAQPHHGCLEAFS
ncbi:MAG TPA: hypothetical protein VGJ48_18125, partial [Pyrinomonadaceae bacterium]